MKKNTQKKIAAGTGLGGILLASAVVLAAPAHAATSCPSDGHISPYETCSSLSNGVLDHYASSNYSSQAKALSTSYYKSGGGQIYRQFGWSAPFSGMSTQWSGWGYQSSGTTNSYSKTVSGNLSNCKTTQGYMNVSGSGIYTTPYVGNC
ncbi:hypothetical protein [Streptacidiphilus anmyonensis]|uniref:hypothetical protein n=1 Tax=Streptacidiphilus anmyonensis TaxID=405782 RepID=UPI0005A8D957|nr:hypothetical protein [Streptacidiphilus anmyonensis]